MSSTEPPDPASAEPAIDGPPAPPLGGTPSGPPAEAAGPETTTTTTTDPIATEGSIPTTTEPAPAEPPPTPRVVPVLRFERSAWFPKSRLGRAAAVVVLTALTIYVATTMTMRLQALMAPWTADGDQAQAVWHYWRYHIKGAFPPGDLLTDYAFAMHAPPVWWAMMASLSTFFEPLAAAKVLNVVAYVATVVVILLAVARRSNIFVGAAAAFLLARNVDFHGIIAGGYARSFGPMLTLLFLGTFMAGRHKLTLVVLVLQAALYPSVVIPCGLAYGVYTVVAGPMPVRLRRMAGMFVCGLLIIALGKSQDIVAKEWWGPLVTEAEALKMPAWGRGGRITEAPLKPISKELLKNGTRAFRVSGPPWVDGPTVAAATKALPVAAGSAAVGCLLGFGALLYVRRRRAEPVIDPFPWQVPLLLGGALVAYFLARALAFKLYLPYRPLQHVVPYMYYAGIPLLLWSLTVNLLPRRRALATVVACALAVVPVVAFFGHGVDKGPGTYSNYAGNRHLYTFVRKLPQNSMIAGDFVHTSSIPLMAHQNVYINKNLTHPFRTGYYMECERRILETYRALYARSFADVLDFAAREKIDFMAFSTTAFSSPDKRLFQPIKKTLDALWTKNARLGFAMQNPPKSAVVFTRGTSVVVDMKKLAAAVAADPALLAPAPPPPPQKAKPPVPRRPSRVVPTIPMGPAPAPLLQPADPR